MKRYFSSKSLKLLKAKERSKELHTFDILKGDVDFNHALEGIIHTSFIYIEEPMEILIAGGASVNQPSSDGYPSM